MKKLLMIALFSFGILAIGSAQGLVYSLTNSGTDNWDYKMTDDVSGTVTTELNILPTQTRTGFVTGFGFNLEFKAANNNGCSTYQLVPAPTNGVYVPITACGVPTALKYRVTLLFPSIYFLELKFG